MKKACFCLYLIVMITGAAVRTFSVYDLLIKMLCYCSGFLIILPDHKSVNALVKCGCDLKVI
jgi:hypothetical protein